MDYIKHYAFYKPTKSGKGAAAQFKLTVPKDSVFVEAANQDSSSPDAKKFLWDDKVNIKLGMTDLEKLIYGLGTKNDIELFHQSTSGTSTVKLKNQADSKYGGFYITLTSKAKDGDLKKVGLPISDSEAVGLRLALQAAFVKILGWE